MDETQVLIALSIVVLVLSSVLIWFKRKQSSTAIQKPTVRKLEPSKLKNKAPIATNTTKGSKKANKKNNNKKGSKIRNSAQAEQNIAKTQPLDIAVPPVKLPATIIDNLFEFFYYSTTFDKMEAQSDTGNVQYARKMEVNKEEEYEEIQKQMEFRLSEGVDEAIYVLGMDASGIPCGVTKENLGKYFDVCKSIAVRIPAVATILRIRDAPGQEDKYVAEVVIRRSDEDGSYREVRIAIIGNVDTGKTTLLGVLSKGGLDNGRGKARANIFKHKHELDTGRTSDVGREIVGFNTEGKIINYSSSRAPTWNEICQHASKVLSFIDLAGHEKYLKTTVFGLTGNYPDYSMLMIGANMGVIGMTKEHYHLTLALKVPCFIVVTKIDICPPAILEQTLTMLKRLLKAPGSKKLPLMINNADDVILAARNFNSERMAPIFQISNVTGQNLDLIRLFMSLISPRKNWKDLREKPALLHIDNTFSVPGVGTVVSGTLTAGRISVNDTLMHGPNQFGAFDPVFIKGIHTNRMPVKMARAGQSVSLALKKVKRGQTRKGQVLASAEMHPKAIWEFDADIFVITHSTTICTSYEAVIHCGCTRQTASIIDIEGVLRAGLRGRVRFRYKYKPEFIQNGDRIIFREGKTKGIGNVHTVYYPGQ